MKEPLPVECFFVHLPDSRRGTSRNLLVPKASMTLDNILSSEAYAYRTCMAVSAVYTKGYHSPHDFGPMIYIGAMLTFDDFLSSDDGWRNAFPRKHRYGGEDYKAHLVDTLLKPSNGRRPIALAVDRYGDVYPMYEGDSIEPVDWNEVQPIRMQITPNPEYDEFGKLHQDKPYKVDL